jgi:hypothetical protein
VAAAAKKEALKNERKKSKRTLVASGTGNGNVRMVAKRSNRSLLANERLPTETNELVVPEEAREVDERGSSCEGEDPAAKPDRGSKFKDDIAGLAQSFASLPADSGPKTIEEAEAFARYQ